MPLDTKHCICKYICVFEIRFAKGVEKDLDKISAYYSTQILDGIRSQLIHAPDAPTRNRKILVNLIPPWEAIPPIWQLQIGQYRVFYDVSHADQVVFVRAVRRKPPGSRTEDIL